MKLSPQHQRYFYILAAILIFYLLFTISFPGDKREKYQSGGATTDDQIEQISIPATIIPSAPPANDKPTTTDQTSSSAFPSSETKSIESPNTPTFVNPMTQTPDKSHLLIEIPRKVTCENNADCNIVYGQGKNKCIGGKCQCSSGVGTFCHQRKNYYKDPRDMTPAQVIKFRKKAKMENMTTQDYINWLSLFRYDIESLPIEHRRNFQRYLQGLPIYDIPLSDPAKEFYASQAAKSDQVCLNIPNSEVDSPLNWKINAQLNNSGIMDVRGNTERPLNWARYYKHPALNESGERFQSSEQQTSTKDWFYNNMNWLFTDVDRHNAAYKDPNQNRFLNIIDGQRPSNSPKRVEREQSEILPTQEGTIVPANSLSEFSSSNALGQSNL